MLRELLGFATGRHFGIRQRANRWSRNSRPLKSTKNWFDLNDLRNFRNYLHKVFLTDSSNASLGQSKSIDWSSLQSQCWVVTWRTPVWPILVIFISDYWHSKLLHYLFRLRDSRTQMIDAGNFIFHRYSFCLFFANNSRVNILLLQYHQIINVLISRLQLDMLLFRLVYNSICCCSDSFLLNKSSKILKSPFIKSTFIILNKKWQLKWPRDYNEHYRHHGVNIIYSLITA